MILKGANVQELSVARDLTKQMSMPKLQSQLHLFYCPTNKSLHGNDNTVKLVDLLRSADLMQSYQFNFSIDVDLVLDYLHPDFLVEQRPLIFICGSPVVSKEVQANLNVTEIIAPLPIAYGTHHTKMMINVFMDSLEIVIMTANLTRLDFMGLTQMCWRSGQLHKRQTTKEKGKRFQAHLCDYLNHYKSAKLTDLSKQLRNYCFDDITVDLIASVPGSHKLDSKLTYGYGSLYQSLNYNNAFVEKDHIIAQVSSMATSLGLKGTSSSSIFTHVLCPIVCGETFKVKPGDKVAKAHQKRLGYTPHIVFPSTKDVLANDLGIIAGSMLHYKYSGSNAIRQHWFQNIKPYICKWNNGKDISGRETTLPHVKLYMATNENNWDSLKWVLMCSHNLSKQAWGTPKPQKTAKDESLNEYTVASYELGVLITDSKHLSPIYKNDASTENTIRLPISLPPTKYDKDELPWTQNYARVL